jgi:hypothetical protein
MEDIFLNGVFNGKIEDDFKNDYYKNILLLYPDLDPSEVEENNFDKFIELKWLISHSGGNVPMIHQAIDKIIEKIYSKILTKRLNKLRAKLLEERITSENLMSKSLNEIIQGD